MKKGLLIIFSTVLMAGFVGNVVAMQDAVQTGKLKAKVLKHQLLNDFGREVKIVREQVKNYGKQNPQRIDMEKVLKLYEEAYRQLSSEIDGNVSYASLLNLKKAFDFATIIGGSWGGN